LQTQRSPAKPYEQKPRGIRSKRLCHAIGIAKLGHSSLVLADL